MNNAGIASNVHCWKEKTTIIAGDSMLNGLDERRLGNKGNVKVRAFPGSTIADLRKSTIFSHCWKSDHQPSSSTSELMMQAKKVQMLMKSCMLCSILNQK